MIDSFKSQEINDLLHHPMDESTIHGLILIIDLLSSFMDIRSMIFLMSL